MSKTFKSALDSPVTLEVERETHPAGVYLTIGQATILLGASDAPALALAILEAAGAHKDSQDFLGGAVEQLKFHIGEQDRATAEARERAELEAEALELFKASGAYGSDRFFLKFSDLEETTQSAWLAVARRARELAKEATK